MTIRRFSAAVFAATLLTPALAACTGTGTGEPGASATPTVTGSATPAPTGSASPAPTGSGTDQARQALLNSTNEIRKGNFRFTIAGAGSTAEGQVHEPSQSAQTKIVIGGADADLSLTLNLVHIKPDSWVKADVGGGAAPRVTSIQGLDLTKYQHLDQTRIQGNRNLGFDFEKLDPAGSEVLTQSITEVRETGPGTFAGTVDLTKAAEAGSLDATLLTRLGEQGRSVPFTARLDPQGRLSEMTVQLPAAGEGPAGELKISYSDYGSASPAQKPPADQVAEAPEGFYNLFR